jgi:hypothetical protein
MRIVLAVLLTSHALIHLMGFLKAFGFAELSQLTAPISKPLGMAWLVGACGILISQFVIASSWGDAKFGTFVNLVALVLVVHNAFSRGPFGLSAAYHAEVRRSSTGEGPPPVPVTEADLAPLPVLVQRYLRFAGVVGQPLVHNYRVRFIGRIRSAADAPWMEFTAEQVSFSNRPKRLFLMDARMKGLPVDVFHSYIDADARMQVKLLSLYPMVDSSGFDFTTAETVTLFNDMCILAPATLISPAITWRVIDSESVEGTFTHFNHTISAVLHFDDSGALVNFSSEDRPRLAPDGKTLMRERWSNPLTGYRAYGPFRLASHGDARYAPASGEFTYGEFDLQAIEYNVGLAE